MPANPRPNSKSPTQATASKTCRFCAAPLSQTVVDLGVMPPANYYLRTEDLGHAEPFYPLHAYVCDSCRKSVV